MRSPSIYPVAHAKHTLNHIRFAAAVQPMNFMRVPHSREKDASLDVTIPGSIQQASGWKLLHLHHQSTPQHDGPVESWGSPNFSLAAFKISDDQKRLKIPPGLPDIVSIVFCVSGLYRNALETRPGNVSVQGFGSANKQISILDQSWSAGRMKRRVSARTTKRVPFRLKKQATIYDESASAGKSLNSSNQSSVQIPG